MATFESVVVAAEFAEEPSTTITTDGRIGFHSNKLVGLVEIATATKSQVRYSQEPNYTQASTSVDAKRDSYSASSMEHFHTTDCYMVITYNCFGC